MKKRFTMAAALLTLVLGFGFSGTLLSSGPAGQDDLALVVKGNNGFAFDLYSAISKEKGNLFLSPYSISSALAMTYAGARGETAKQMERTLHFDLAGTQLNLGFSELRKKLHSSAKSYQLSVANALWGQQGAAIYPEFIETIKKFYDAGFEEVDYVYHTDQARLIINNWVEAETDHKIIELIKPYVLTTLTRLVLTNAIYFKGQWEWQFKPEQNQRVPFVLATKEIVIGPMMVQVGKFKYAETDQLQVLELPYSGGEMAMDILLPKANSDLAALESQLQAAGFESLLDKISIRKVAVFLPPFKLEKGFLLSDTLRNLGMRDAFDSNVANFSGMSKTFLYITHVVHKAFVEVNEEGTKAAAATAVIIDTKSAVGDKALVFRADHPFFFLIRDVQSGSILFMGRMADPR